MGLALVLIVLALVIGGISLFVSALKWALIIAGALLVAGVVVGWARRSSAG